MLYHYIHTQAKVSNLTKNSSRSNFKNQQSKLDMIVYYTCLISRIVTPVSLKHTAVMVQCFIKLV